MRKKNVLTAALMVCVFIFACGGGQDHDASPPDTHQNAGQASGGKGTVTFAAFANTGFTGDTGSYERLIRAVNGYGVDFSVNLGNSLPEGVRSAAVGPLWNAVEETVAEFDAPVYPVTGSQDVFDYASDVEYTRRYGPQWYSFERGGTLFIVLNTVDEAYRRDFGRCPWIGDEQLEWLMDVMKDSQSAEATVLFMASPLWTEAPALWSGVLSPVLKTGKISLMVTGYRNGLFDWGIVDGIKAVSTGCVGPVDRKHPGLFAHALIVTVNGGKSLFRVLYPDGTSSENITVNGERVEAVMKLAAPLKHDVLPTDPSWNIREDISLSFKNSFAEPVTVSFDFTVFPKTDWVVDPVYESFEVSPGVTKTVHVRMRGDNPELGPLPVYTSRLAIGDAVVYEKVETLALRIPRPRTGDLIPVSAEIRAVIPYEFDGSPLTVPVEIKHADTCGRLIIYGMDEAGNPVCVHVAPLRDFKPGINEFVWDGQDLQGNRVAPEVLSYLVVAYNKKAPVTWVAEGPPAETGSLRVERTLSGLAAVTHTTDSRVAFRINTSKGIPKPEIQRSYTDVLAGERLNGIATGDHGTEYLGTDAGVACVYTPRGNTVVNASFGDRGYVRFTGFRGKKTGCPVYHDGRLYIGIGGGYGEAPGVLVLDGETGAQEMFITLRDYYRDLAEPPAVWIDGSGLYCAHPDDEDFVMLTPEGEALWDNGDGDGIGDLDQDGRSHTWGIGADHFGLMYVCATGSSARCGVVGPDGKGLFRVILVQLPGLRVSSVFPLIEGLPTDGLYLVTRGGDRPYVFHVPYTIRAGSIVPGTGMTGG